MAARSPPVAEDVEEEGTDLPGPLDEETILSAFSDPTARKILTTCVREPLSVKEISGATGIPLGSAYRHVNSLVESGLLLRARSAISEEGKRYELYRSRIRQVTVQVTEDGVEVSWEVDEEVEERIERMWKELRRY